MNCFELVTGSTATLIAGATGSLHCALMCGPLACAVPPAGGGSGLPVSLAWQGGRASAYALVGLVLGAAGSGLARVLTVDVQRALPWVMALGLVMSAFELGRHLKPLPGVARVSGVLARAGARLPPWGRALLLGAATPFLPCGLLYGFFVSAMASGSGLNGAVLMLAFALGSGPALFAVQLGANAWARWPKATALLRRTVPLVAAIVIVARALMAPETQGADCG